MKHLPTFLPETRINDKKETEEEGPAMLRTQGAIAARWGLFAERAGLEQGPILPDPMAPVPYVPVPICH